MRRSLRRISLLFGALFFLVPAAASRAEDKTPAAGKPAHHALLVGVTDYPSLPREFWLDGPVNDGPILRDVLCDKFGFERANVVILSEAEAEARGKGKGDKNPDFLPTRANIERECKRLAALAKAGDQVVVQLGGHGSQQPDPPGAKRPHPDGMDRVFLPRDVRDWEKGPERIPNAISGTELGEWLRPIAERKATLWVIVDACHSGEMLRGVNEKARQLDAVRGLKVPPAAIAAARARAAGVKKDPAGDFSPTLAQLEGVALLYACQSNEVTVERRIPLEGPDAKPHGLLTYTITRLLRSSEQPLTYAELTRRIQAEYVAMDRTFPTPVLEGTDRNRAILSRDRIRRSPLLLSESDEALTVNGGQLNGLLAGSILAVYPPPGQKGDVRGYVKITTLKATLSEVEPCAFGKVGMQNRKALIGGRCEVAQTDFGDLRLSIAVDRLGSKASPAELDALDSDLKALAEKPGSPVTYVKDQKTSEWLVRVADGKAYLLRASEWADERGSKAPGKKTGFAPEKLGPGVTKWLEDAGTRIVKAQNLLRLAAGLPGDGDEAGDYSPKVKVEMVRRGAPEKAEGKGGAATLPVLHDGDRVHFKITNVGNVPVDVTLLYIDSKFGISAIFPKVENNRFRPGESRLTPSETIGSETTGREQVVILAVKGDNLQPVDFVSLTQKNIDEARKSEKARGKAGLDTPLGRLLGSAILRDGKTRSMGRTEVANYSLGLIPLQIEAGKRKE